MKRIFSDFKKGIVKLKITSPEDCWYLSQIIEPNDIISGKTMRKITLGSEETKTIQKLKPVFLKINAETIDFSKSSTALRVSGKIIEAPDDVPLGSYHTFTIGQDSEFTLEKPEWLSYHKTQLKEALEATHEPVLLCIFDRDEAILAVSKQYGYEILAKLKGDMEKKEKRALTKSTFYPELIKLLVSYNEKLKPKNIILASPAFYKEDLAKQITDKAIKQKLILATCSSASENAVDEVLKRPETRTALHQIRVAQETELVEKLLTEIAKEGLAAYGLKQVKLAADAAAISELLVTNQVMKDCREKEKFKELNDIIKQVDAAKGAIHIISTEHEAGKKLHGLGGIAALLRYKLEW